MPKKVSGWKGSMRRTVLQQAKAAEKLRRQSLKKAPKKSQPAPARSQSSTGSPPDVHRDESWLTMESLGQGFRQMAPAGGVLATGLGVTALASKGGGLLKAPKTGPAKSKGSPMYPPPSGFTPGGGGFGNPFNSRAGPKSGHSSASAPNGTPNVETVIMPVVYGSQKKGTNPKMWAKANKGDVVVTVEHTEYLKDLVGVGSATFPASAAATGAEQFFANPGQVKSFPWLSTLADNFDEYKFDYLEITYEPSVGTDSDGKFLATFDPDVLDQYPDTKQDMLQARVQLDAVPWARSKLNVPKDLLAEWRYVRTGSVPDGADQHVYDAGVFNIAAPGAPSGMIGECFVSYKCKLRTPNGGRVKAGTAVSNGAAVGSVLGTSDFTVNAASNLIMTRQSATTFSIDTPGVYFASVAIVGTGFAGNTNITAAGDNTATVVANAFTATAALATVELKVVDPADVFTVAQPAGAATLTQSSLYLSMWNDDLSV